MTAPTKTTRWSLFATIRWTSSILFIALSTAMLWSYCHIEAIKTQQYAERRAATVGQMIASILSGEVLARDWVLTKRAIADLRDSDDIERISAIINGQETTLLDRVSLESASLASKLMMFTSNTHAELIRTFPIGAASTTAMSAITDPFSPTENTEGMEIVIQLSTIPQLNAAAPQLLIMMAVTLTAMGIILGVVWWSSKALQRFINRMTAGFEQAEKGTHEHKIQLSRCLELAALELKFNNLQRVLSEFDKTMKERIKEAEAKKQIAYDQLKKEKEALEEAQKAKVTFLANISHELKTPLGSIMHCGDLLLAHTQDSRQRSWLSSIKANVNELSGLIGSMLDYNVVAEGSLKITQFRVADAIKSAVAGVTGQLQDKGVKLYVSLDVYQPIISDEGRIKEILRNLVSNAAKHTSTGFIHVGAALTIQDGANLLELFVVDTGIGIDQKHHESIFDRFTQVDQSDTRPLGGKGLGLSMVAQAVDQLRGTKHVDSALGKGSRFTVVIPVDVEQRASMLVAIKTARLITNDMRLFEAVSSQLKGLGYTICDSGKSDLLITDDRNNAELRRVGGLAGRRVLLSWDSRDGISGGDLWQTQTAYDMLETWLASTPIAPPRDCFTQTPQRILLVDDNAEQGSLTGDVLQMLGHRVVVAIGPSNALDVCSKQSFDVMFIDQQMPKMDGTTLVKTMKAQGLLCNAKTICLTGNAMAFNNAELVAEFDELLIRPVDKDRLNTVIMALTAHQRAEADIRELEAFLGAHNPDSRA